MADFFETIKSVKKSENANIYCKLSASDFFEGCFSHLNFVSLSSPLEGFKFAATKINFAIAYSKNA